MARLVGIWVSQDGKSRRYIHMLITVSQYVTGYAMGYAMGRVSKWQALKGTGKQVKSATYIVSKVS